MTQILLIDEKTLQELKEELANAVVHALKASFAPAGNERLAEEWLDTTEAKKILGYRSKSKMQKMRDSKAIVFSKFGRKIKYKRQSLLEYIEKNKR